MDKEKLKQRVGMLTKQPTGQPFTWCEGYVEAIEDVQALINLLDEPDQHIYEHPNVGWMMFDNKLNDEEVRNNGLTYKGTLKEYKDDGLDSLAAYLDEEEMK